MTKNSTFLIFFKYGIHHEAVKIMFSERIWREEKFHCYTDKVKWKPPNQMQNGMFWWSQFCEILCPAEYLKVKKCTVLKW